MIVSISPFYKGGNRHTENKDLVVVSHIISRETGFQIEPTYFQSQTLKLSSLFFPLIFFNRYLLKVSSVSVTVVGVRNTAVK